MSKLRKFFGTNKVAGGGVKERDLWPELEKELRPEIPVAQRCKTLKDLGDLVLTTKLEDASVSKLWELTKDLIVDNKSTEHRQTTLSFYKKLIQGQYANLSMMREHFFIVIQKHDVPEDLKHRLDLLITLTDNGKDITNFEEKIGRFMLDWEPSIVDAGLTEPYLEMLINIIKFNVAHLDNEIVVDIVRHACHLTCSIEDTEIGLRCLRVLDAIICYAIFPNETLALCIVTLCRTINVGPYCQTSWKIMKNLLGTTLGHSSLLTMCQILNDKNFYRDEGLLRGAICYINLGLWSSTSSIVPMLKFSTSKVLMSFLNALSTKQVIVTYEVIFSIQMMIPKYGKDLPEHIWDVICDILFVIADNIAYFEANGLSKELGIQEKFHDTIDIIEEMLQKDEICANTLRIYDLIEKIAEHRSEISVLNLIEYRSSKVTATRPQWLQVLSSFVHRFYKIPNTKVRIKTVQSLIQIMDANRSAYEEEVLDRVVIPQFSTIAYEPDLLVRTAVCKALIDFAWHCDTKRCGELLDILEKILNRPFELYNEGFIFKTENEIQDVLTVVEGLIEVFMVKLYRLPSCHAIRIFDMLVGHLETHYQRPKALESFNVIRYKIFNWMLKARANKTYHIGYPDPASSGTIRFSHYLGIDTTSHSQGERYQHQTSQSDTIPALNFTTISIRRACKAIVTCLELERDFCVFQQVLKELPNILQNKALIQGNDIETLANTLFKIFFDRKFFDSMVPSSVKLTSDDFNALVLPAIASLIIYHQFLSSSRQLLIIEALKAGIPSRIASICINTLTIMILEMPDTLMRKLPDVLLEMSKMSDTVTVAIPVLEFLSILSRLPNRLFANFVPKQYMYVFAISLPYTKPHRYDHYTVSLAHHVIAGWFLKCKLTFRRNFVNYIMTSIQSNAQLPLPSEFAQMNEDSSNRKRSSSLTERGSRGRDRPNADLRPLMNESLKSFHAELAETCIDFIARHTFSPCSALPKRLPAAEYLLKDGPSQTWLVGHNLITITTSACAAPPTRNGLCERCAAMSKSSSQNLHKSDTSTSNSYCPTSPEILTGTTSQLEGPDLFQNKRYTKASLQYSSGTESGSTDLTASTSSSSQQHEIRALRQISNEGRFSSPSSSIEALSRRGSNPESIDNRDFSSASLLGNSLRPSNQTLVQQQICARSCSAWSEIFIRRPTGNISWIMRIQNPIANDCLGNDMQFNDLINLFMPTQYGGLFGPDFAPNEEPIPQPVGPLTEALQKEITTEQKIKKAEQDAKASAKVLKRQEEITTSSASGPIDIPKKVRRHKEPAGSFSDIDPDEEDVIFEDGDSRSRNPVRRVNSSPEMSSSWRNPFMGNKGPGKPGEGGNAGASGQTGAPEKDEIVCVEADQQQKKKGFSKDMRVSCEAIPEEIAGSTPPSLAESLKDADNSGTKGKKPGEGKTEPEKEPNLPPKQHSADDVTQTTFVTGSTSTTSLKIPLDLQKVTSKPPQSPAPLSPRLLVRNTNNMGSESNGNDLIRGRSKTISVVREVNRNARPTTSFRPRGSNPPTNSRLGINPSFVFLQLYYTGQLQVTEPPIKVSPDSMTAVTLLDLIPPFETHKIGVLYVGPGQCNNETEILKNRFGSVRYVEFLRNLGTLVSLKDAKENNLFVNMEYGRDGNFTYVWKDDIVHVTFHVATLMPNNDNDPNCNEKKKHIGNDYVSIVYNESGEEYNLSTIKGQFNYACVVVQPLELNSNRIFVRAKKEIADFVCHSEAKIVSDGSAPLLARQLALHANLASHVSRSLKTKTPYASNWLERLRKIKNLRSKLVKDSQSVNTGDQDTSGSAGDVSDIQRPNIYDFTKYT